MQPNQALSKQLSDSRAIKVLERSLARNRLGHAILLHGKNFEHIEAIARAVSSLILKTQRDPFEHPDCLILRPQRKARLIKIGSENERINGEWPQNSMRRLVIDMQKSSHQGGRKIGIVFEADRMNVQSANAFLKTLEEPPDGTILFLLTVRPYDLLDTIRSRCINFHIPTEATPIKHPNWPKWINDYQNWLNSLIDKTNKKDIPRIVLCSYGLNVRFQQILAEITDDVWKTQKALLPEHLASEEKNAMEAGLSRGYRKQLFAEIGKATAHFARSIKIGNLGQLPVAAIYRATQSLEHSAALLELNFNQSAALELFFLKSMRIWANVR